MNFVPVVPVIKLEPSALSLKWAKHPSALFPTNNLCHSCSRKLCTTAKIGCTISTKDRPELETSSCEVLSRTATWLLHASNTSGQKLYLIWGGRYCSYCVETMCFQSVDPASWIVLCDHASIRVTDWLQGISTAGSYYDIGVKGCCLDGNGRRSWNFSLRIITCKPWAVFTPRWSKRGVHKLQWMIWAV